jgi:hypothetical protein
MGTPKDPLPRLILDDVINQLLLSIGLPRALSIVSPKVSARYYSIYILAVLENKIMIHRRLVLCVSGKHLLRIKMENGAVVWTWVKQLASIPVPDLVAYDTSYANSIGHEYELLSLIRGVTLSEHYHALTDVQLDNVMDQLAGYLGQLHAHSWNAIGGLRINNGIIAADRIVDETFWQAPDVDEFCL